MDFLLYVFTFLSANIVQIVGYLTMILTGLIGIAMIIPGEHPDKELEAAKNFLLQFSRK